MVLSSPVDPRIFVRALTTPARAAWRKECEQQSQHGCVERDISEGIFLIQGRTQAAKQLQQVMQIYQMYAIHPLLRAGDLSFYRTSSA